MEPAQTGSSIPDSTSVVYDPATGHIHVSLGCWDVIEATLIAKRRHDESRRLGLSGRAGMEVDFGKEFDGAMGETAFARAIGSREKLTVNSFKAADVAGVQVRSTTRADGRLIFRPSDDPSEVFILMVGYVHKWTVIGGIVGAGAQKIGSWETYYNRPGAWFVPQHRLKRIDKSERFGHLFKKSDDTDASQNSFPARAEH